MVSGAAARAGTATANQAVGHDDWPAPEDLIEARLGRFITQHLMHGFIVQHLQRLNAQHWHRSHLGERHMT